MNPVHVALVSYLRRADTTDAGATEAGKSALQLIDGKSDEEVIRMLFGTFRGRDKAARGMRLTNFGMQIMATFFQAYEIKRPEGRKLAPLELIFLDNKARLPYHISDTNEITMFDPELGILLKLCDGDIATLMQIESGRI